MIRAVRPAEVAPPPIIDDPSILGAYLEDASAAAAGRAAGLVRPADEREAAAFLRAAHERGLPLLPQAGRSSLTGGAIPRGEVVVSCERMAHVGAVVRESGRARLAVGPGVRLSDLEARLAAEGLYYPPIPTYREALVGGTVSTNAGGAATFKYGATRRWVAGLRVLLFNGDLLVLERGEAVVRRGESFRIELSDGSELRVPSPEYRLPDLKKISAGYFAADSLDLVDLFIGSEGTLGLISGVTLSLIPRPPATLTGLLFPRGTGGGLRLAGALRDAGGPDMRAIEWLDGKSLDLLRRSEEFRRARIRLPDHAREALLFELEIARETDDAEFRDLLVAFVERRAHQLDHPLLQLFGLLDELGVLEDAELALADPRRQRALADLREAVPRRVGEILAEGRVEKVGGDLIVPCDRLAEMVQIYVRGFERRGLEYAIWGHVGDGNLHPNALPRDAEEVRRGFDALFEFADEAVRRRGCPLSEHGVGRHPVKQELLRRFLGAEAVAQMRRIKFALDPQGRLAPGVIFPSHGRV